jgi:hypothetical protein
VATNGCFDDAKHGIGGVERRAALEQPDRQVWVDLVSSPEVEAVIRPTPAMWAAPTVRFVSAAVAHDEGRRVAGLG